MTVNVVAVVGVVVVIVLVISVACRRRCRVRRRRVRRRGVRRRGVRRRRRLRRRRLRRRRLRLRRRLCRRVIFSRSSPSSSWSWWSSSTCWIFVVGGFLSPGRGPSAGPLPDPLLGGASENLTFFIENLSRNGPFWVGSGPEPFLGSPRTLFADGTRRDHTFLV